MPARRASFSGSNWAQRPSASVREEASTCHSPAGLLPLEAHRDVFRRFAQCSVQNVSGNSIHDREPFLQPEMRDLPLLLGGFVKFRRFVILQTPLGEYQGFPAADLPVAQTMKMRLNFCSYSRLPAARAALISSPAAPTFRCSSPDQAADCGGSGGRRLRIANSRMTAKRFEPIGFREIFPNLVTSSQQSCFVEDRSTSCHFARPGFRTATGQDFLRGFVRLQTVPSREHIL